MVFWTSNQKPYLLDPTVLVDSPVPIFKSLGQIAKENVWGILIVLIFLLSTLLLYLYKKKISPIEETKETEPEIDPFTEALKEFNELSTSTPRPKAKPFIFKLSEILRLYIERQFKLQAMEKTGEEFIQEISIHPLLRQKFEMPLRDFVQRGDRIKYSAENFDSKELSNLLDSAREFVCDAQKDWEEKRRMDEERLSSEKALKSPSS